MRYDGRMMQISVIIPAYKRIDQTLHTLDLLCASEGMGSVFTLEIIVADSTPDESLKSAIQKKYEYYSSREKQDCAWVTRAEGLPLAGVPSVGGHGRTPAAGPQELKPDINNLIVYVRPSKPGIAANKNAGAQAAHNPVLIFCDSDIEVEPDTVAKTLEAMQKHTSAAMIGGTVLWRGGPQDGKKDRPRPEDRLKAASNTTYIEAFYSRYIATYKQVFDAVGGYDEKIFNMRGEGSDLSARYWRAGFPLVYDESIVVHHVHDVPDAAAVRVDHPEWGIAKDFLLLAYKYGMIGGEYRNFMATVAANFSHLGKEGYFRLIEGIGRHFEEIVVAKSSLETFRTADKPAYDFKFLEVFSDEKLFTSCITEAPIKLTGIHTNVFP